MKIDSGIIKMLIVVLAVTIIAALILRHVMEKKGLYESSQKVETSVEETSEETVDDEETKEDDNESKAVSAGNGYEKISADKAVSENTCVQVEKILTEVVDDGKGNQELKYTSYYMSDVNLTALSDSTADYTQCITEDGFDDSKIEKVSFADAFGFSYQGCTDMAEFFELARKSSGFDYDMTDASYDEEKYELMKEESYEFNGDCSILYSMLGDMDYDRLIQSTCYYSLSELEDGTKYPTMFTAIVQYVKGDITYTKTAYLGFSYYKEGETGGCGCGSDSGCGTCEEESCEGTDGCCSDSDSACPSCGGVGGCTEDCTGNCCK